MGNLKEVNETHAPVETFLTKEELDRKLHVGKEVLRRLGPELLFTPISRQSMTLSADALIAAAQDTSSALDDLDMDQPPFGDLEPAIGGLEEALHKVVKI